MLVRIPREIFERIPGKILLLVREGIQKRVLGGVLQKVAEEISEEFWEHTLQFLDTFLKNKSLMIFQENSLKKVLDEFEKKFVEESRRILEIISG